MHRRPLRDARLLKPLALGVVLLGMLVASVGTAADFDPSGHVVVAQASDDSVGADRGADETRPLEARYLPAEPEEKSWYNSDYIFGMTRGVANSTIAPAGKAPLFVLTIPLDIVTLPFTLIGGFFG